MKEGPTMYTETPTAPTVHAMEAAQLTSVREQMKDAAAVLVALSDSITGEPTAAGRAALRGAAGSLDNADALPSDPSADPLTFLNGYFLSVEEDEATGEAAAWITYGGPGIALVWSHVLPPEVQGYIAGREIQRLPLPNIAPLIAALYESTTF